MGVCSGSTGGFMWPISRNRRRSAGRRLSSMKWRNGSAASRNPSRLPILPWLIGSNPAVQDCASTGCMTKNVRNSARPISTVLGGVLWVLRAVRSSDSTMTMRVKAVTITSRLGASESTVISAVIWTSRLVAPAAIGPPSGVPRFRLNDCAWAARGMRASASPRATAARHPCGRTRARITGPAQGRWMAGRTAAASPAADPADRR